jgi:hypothetical protein
MLLLAINGTPFVVGGYKNAVINSTWKYNISGDYWTNDNGAFAGSARQDAIGFSVGNNGYITTGLNGSSRLTILGCLLRFINRNKINIKKGMKFETSFLFLLQILCFYWLKKDF